MTEQIRELPRLAPGRDNISIPATEDQVPVICPSLRVPQQLPHGSDHDPDLVLGREHAHGRHHLALVLVQVVRGPAGPATVADKTARVTRDVNIRNVTWTKTSLKIFTSIIKV